MLIINNDTKRKTYEHKKDKKKYPGKKWVITAAPLCTLLRIRDRTKTMSTHFVRNYRKHTHIFLIFSFLFFHIYIYIYIFLKKKPILR